MGKGFSLIELMVVIAVIAILATLAYPSYQEYLTRSRRSDGQNALLDLANRMEHFYSKNHTYQTATIASGKSTDVLATPYSQEGWYVLSISSQTPSSYALQARPVKSQSTQDKRCQTLTLNNVGVKGITQGPNGLPTGPVSKCW